MIGCCDFVLISRAGSLPEKAYEELYKKRSGKVTMKKGQPGASVEAKEGKRHLISAIVACYNEEMRVAETIEALLGCPSVDEIIAINDGSTDNTLEILKRFEGRIEIIDLGKNEGKGFAMAEGVRRARGDIVLFVDAHLLNLQDSHIRKLVEPLMEGEADVTLGISLPKAVSPLWPWTGQRAYLRESFLPHLEVVERTRFGVEAYLNEAFEGKRVVLVRLEGLIHLPKHQKMPLSEVFDSYLIEAVEIAQTLAEMRGAEVRNIREALSPKRIRSIKSLTEKVGERKVREIISYIKEHIIPYLEGKF